MTTRILVVDDATFIRDLVKKTLWQKFPGVDILDATDGRKAQSVLKREKDIDLILSDWEMPEVSGEEFLRWVRETPEYKDTPFIMVTSRGDKDYVVQAIQAGVNDYIAKPFSADELFKKVFKQLKRINKLPELPKRGQTQGVANASVGALVGGGAKPTATKKPAVSSGDSLGALTDATLGRVSKATTNAARMNTAVDAKLGSKQAAAKSAASSDSGGGKEKIVRAKARLRFPDSQTSCDVYEASLRVMKGQMQRPEVLPRLFDPAVIDIEGTRPGEEVTQINAYIHSMEAASAVSDAKAVNITLQFVDADPEKMMALSKILARGTGVQFTG
ncbi:MAG: response regulator [Cellvibrionaceae bacterium]